jgi:hypothetical protein
MDRSDLLHLLYLVLLLAAVVGMRFLPRFKNGSDWRRLRSRDREKEKKRSLRPPRS